MMKIIVLVPRTLVPPLSPPFAGDKLPSSESGLALLPLSSVMGVSCNTPFDDVDSVGNGVSFSTSSEEDDEERGEDKDPADSSEVDATPLLSELSRLAVSLELLLLAVPESLRPVLPELERETKADDNEDEAPELELDATVVLDDCVLDPASEKLSKEDNKSADPLVLNEEPDITNPLEDPADDDKLDINPADDTELDADPVEPSITYPDPDMSENEDPDASTESDSELDPEGGIAVTGGGLVGVAVGVEVGAVDALPDSEPEFDGGIAVTGGGLVGLGLGVGVGAGDALLEPDSDGGIAVTGGGLVGVDDEDPLDDPAELDSPELDAAEFDAVVEDVVTVGVVVETSVAPELESSDEETGVAGVATGAEVAASVATGVAGVDTGAEVAASALTLVLRSPHP
ncbi:unnamed protein product [Phytophthora lilii]|uniref:Unnamed protein product n=1 Tax=Phytophthora lilii TaxID=2077276 RepID=A0A9W6TY49_9STRA|nr:unnamed protein product [Phytophthora lilii]